MATAAPGTELGRKRQSTSAARTPTFSLSRSVKKALSGADAGSAIAVERRPDQDADDLEVHLVRRRGGDGGKALYAIGGGSLAVLVAFLLYMDTSAGSSSPDASAGSSSPDTSPIAAHLQTTARPRC